MANECEWYRFAAALLARSLNDCLFATEHREAEIRKEFCFRGEIYFLIYLLLIIETSSSKETSAEPEPPQQQQQVELS